MGSSTLVLDEVYIHEDGASDTEYISVEASTLVQVITGSLVTLRIYEGIEHDIAAIGVAITESLEFCPVVYHITPTISFTSEYT